MQSQVFTEGIIVGILSVFIGSLVIYVFFSTNKVNQRKQELFLPLFLTGFFIHLICEATGVNKLYCKEGSACK